MKMSILFFLHFLKIWSFPIIKIQTLLKNSNQKFVNFTIKVRLFDYLLAKDWYLEFRPCDVCSVTRRSVWLYENNKITNVRQLPLYFAIKMSDNESFDSQTEGSTDNENIAEQSSFVQQYQFEPVTDSDYGKTKQTKTAFFVKLLRRDLRKM
jgi:hypothetical protein